MVGPNARATKALCGVCRSPLSRPCRVVLILVSGWLAALNPLQAPFHRETTLRENMRLPFDDLCIFKNEFLNLVSTLLPFQLGSSLLLCYFPHLGLNKSSQVVCDSISCISPGLGRHRLSLWGCYQFPFVKAFEKHRPSVPVGSNIL